MEEKNKDIDPFFEESWDFWKGIILNPDGSVNIDQLKKELGDYYFILDQLPKVYCHITGNTLSKPMYFASSVISAYDSEIEKIYERADKEHDKKNKSLTKENEDLKEVNKELSSTVIRMHNDNSSLKEWKANHLLESEVQTHLFSETNRLEEELKASREEVEKLKDVPPVENLPSPPKD